MRCYITVPNNHHGSAAKGNDTATGNQQPLALTCSRQKVLGLTSPSNNQNSGNGSGNNSGSSNSNGNEKRSNTMSISEEWYLIPDDDEEPGIVKVVNRAHNLALECPPVGKLSARAITDMDNDNDENFLWSLEKIQDEEDNTSGSSSSSCCSVRLRSVATNFYLSYTITNHGSFVTCCAAAAAIQSSSATEDPTATNNNPATATTLWKLEYCTGELCYIHHQPPLEKSLASTFMTKEKTKSTTSTPSQQPHQRRLLMCDNLGRLRLTKVFGGWEVWRFLHAGNGTVRISSWTHQENFLVCDKQGRVTTTEDRWNEATLWKIERASMEGVSIQSTKYKRYLTIQDSSGSLCALTMFPGSLGTWQFTAAHRQQYYLSNMGQDKRLSLLKNNAVKISRHRRDCEIWELEALEHGFVMLRSQRWGKFLKCENQRLGVSEDPKDEAVLRTCIWKIIPSPVNTNGSGDGGGGVCVISAMEHGLALSCHSETGELLFVPQNETISECWNLEPCMPDSLQQWQINLMVGGAIGAALLPVVAMGAVAAAAGSGVAAGGSAAVGTLAVTEAAGAVVGASGAAAGAVVGASGAAGAVAGASGAAGAVVGVSGAAAATAATATAGVSGAAAATAATAATATTVAAEGAVVFGLAEAGGAMVAGAALGASATGIVAAASGGVRLEGSPISTATHGRSFCEWRSW